MFFGKPGKATKTKKAVYLIAAVILGLMLSFMVHAAIEKGYINYMDGQGQLVSFYGGCALAPWLQLLLWLLGAASGYFLGAWWWRKLYVDRVWAKSLK